MSIIVTPLQGQYKVGAEVWEPPAWPWYWNGGEPPVLGNPSAYRPLQRQFNYTTEAQEEVRYTIVDASNGILYTPDAACSALEYGLSINTGTAGFHQAGVPYLMAPSGVTGIKVGFSVLEGSDQARNAGGREVIVWRSKYPSAQYVRYVPWVLDSVATPTIGDVVWYLDPANPGAGWNTWLPMGEYVITIPCTWTTAQGITEMRIVAGTKTGVNVRSKLSVLKFV
jgi:hypothetical protein